jgi:putative ABC transport system permease protein
VGDTVEVAFMTGLRETHEMAVTGLVEQYLGLGAYADIDFLDAQFRRSEQMSVVNVLIDPLSCPTCTPRCRRRPRCRASF